MNGSVAEVAAVVGEEDDDGIVGDLFFIEELEDASDVGIEVVNDGGVALHTEGFVFAGDFGEFFPAPDVGHGRSILIAVVDEAELAESGDALFAKDGPTFVKGAVVFFDELAGNVERSMWCVEGEVGEEGLVGFERFLDAFDGVGGERIGGEPVNWNGFGPALSHDVAGAGKIIDGSAEEAVKLVEVVVQGVAGLMPFSGDGGLVASGSEGFGKRKGAAVVLGLGMLVSGEEGGAGDDAHRVDPKIGEARTLG